MILHDETIPYNWAITNIGSIAAVKGGKRLPTGSSYCVFPTPYPYLRVSDFRNGSIDPSSVKFIDSETQNKIKNYTIAKEDLYISIAGTIGVVGRIPPEYDGANLTENAAKIACSPAVDPDFLCTLLSSYKLQNEFRKLTVSSSQPKLALFRIEAQRVPLPPLNEQRRIVAKIEELTGRSRRAKEAIDGIPVLLDRLRQSVLAAAFRGDLTGDWRAKNEASAWESTTLGYVASSFQNGISKRRGDHGQPVHVLRLADIVAGDITDLGARFIRLTPLELDKYGLAKGDLVAIRVNGSADLVGAIVVVRDDQQRAFCDHFIRIKLRREIANPAYIAYALQSPLARRHITHTMVSSAGQNTINQGSLSAVPLKLPCVEEQEEIVRILNATFESIASISEMERSLQERFRTINQSILAKAFRGELVAQDPNDEPASVLLERIQSERAEAVVPKARRGRKPRELAHAST